MRNAPGYFPAPLDRIALREQTGGMSLADLLAYCAEHDIHGTYRCKREGPDRWRAYISTNKVGTNGIDTTREKALDRIAANVLKELTDPWVSPYSNSPHTAYNGVYGRSSDAE
jgi:hypothetical protein